MTMFNATRARWSDNDRYFGPFTYSRSDRGWRPLAIVLGSGHDDYAVCTLRISGFGHTFIAALPAIIKPWRVWVDISRHAWSSPNGGYWDQHVRQFGFSCSDGFLQVFLGPQTHDSSTTRSWSKFLPWTQWRHVRYSLYDANGEHYWTEPKRDKAAGFGWLDESRKAQEACPSRRFMFRDYDGEVLTVTAQIDEREWRFGEGHFKWLSLFRRPKICRSLDLKFSGETGRRKGSWKGGTIGHSVEMLHGELHESAFRRYCAEKKMEFIFKI